MLDHIGQIAQAAADKFGDREALVFEDRSFSFQELNTMVEAAAGGVPDAHHEDVFAGLLAALSARLLLVDAEELRELLGIAGEGRRIALLERLHLVPEGVRALGVGNEEEALALALDALVARHLLKRRARERHRSSHR